MNGSKTETAVNLLKKAKDVLKDADNQNLKRAEQYLKVSIQLLSRA